MTKGLTRSLSRGAATRANIRKVKIPLRNVAISNVGATGVGFGFATLGGLPEGNLLFLGAIAYLQFNKNGDVDIQDTFDGDYSIGTAGTVDVDVGDAGKTDFIPSTALGAATAGLSPVVRGASVVANTGNIIDNTAKDKNVILNLLIDDANISGTASMLVNGYVELAFIPLGDD